MNDITLQQIVEYICLIIAPIAVGFLFIFVFPFISKMEKKGILNIIFSGICFLLLIKELILIQSYYQITRYIFLLRVPIIIGLLFFLLPILSFSGKLKSLFKNLYILPNVVQLFFVLIGANLTGRATILVFNLIWNNVDSRFGVSPLPPIPELLQYTLGFILCLPTWVITICASYNEIKKLGLYLLSIIFSILVIVLQLRYLDPTHNNHFTVLIQTIIVPLSSILPIEISKGFVENKQLTDEFFDMLIFIVTLACFYIPGYFFLSSDLFERELRIPIFNSELKLKIPDKYANLIEAPALYYVTILLSAMVLLLGFISFFLDYIHVPILLPFVLITGIVYLFFQIDHFYILKPKNNPDLQDAQDYHWQEAVYQRLEYYGSKDKLVVVCANGGGIQAAGWTTTVLTGLQKEEKLGTEFIKAICWMSTVSGGSVGTMYYLDSFQDDQGYANPDSLDKIFDNATQDALNAIGWGLAYPDFLRFIGFFPFLLCSNYEDRGTAIERKWNKNLTKITQNSEIRNITLEDWEPKIKKGHLPIPVFNATLVEDGRRFLISPIQLVKKPEDKYYTDFHCLYPGCTIDVATGARLSATFPYVSPVCCPKEIPVGSGDKYFHVADGGYFDNFGVVTSVQMLDKLLERNQKESQHTRIKKVIFIRINAFPNSSNSEHNKNKGEPGWLMALFGSLKAVLNVRQSTQNSGNELSIKLLQNKWGYQKEHKRVDIVDFEFTFPQSSIEPPLSWKLTKNEKTAIKEAWGNNNIQEVVENIIKEWECSKAQSKEL